MGKSANLYVLCTLLLVVGLVVGFVLGKGLSKGGINSLTSLDNSKLYTTQTATIRGKVTKVEGKTLTVQNSQGTTGTIEASDKVLVSKLRTAGSTAPASPSSDLKQVTLNEEVLITLQLTEGTYKAVLIQYLPPLPPLPKLPATKSATPANR